MADHLRPEIEALTRRAEAAEAEARGHRKEQSAIAKELALEPPYQASLAKRAAHLFERTERAEANEAKLRGLLRAIRDQFVVERRDDGSIAGVGYTEKGLRPIVEMLDAALGGSHD